MFRLLRLSLLVAATSSVLAVPVAAAEPVLPDLVADAVEKPRIVDDPDRRLLRFDGFVHNAGFGALEVRRISGGGGIMQRAYSSLGAFEDRAIPGAEVEFETSDGHNHFHFQHAARYSLWNAEATGELAPSMKVGFCLLDSQQRASDAPPKGYTADCQKRDGLVVMGVTAGWRDLYDSGLPFQWVDVSSVTPGRHRLRAEVDPNQLIEESAGGEGNTPTDVEVNVPGYVARPAAIDVRRDETKSVELTADEYIYPSGQRLAARQVRVERAPTHGTLDAPVGEWVDAATVRYTPTASSTAPEDSFSFSVREAGSRYPLSPVAAAVILRIADAPAPPPEAPAPPPEEPGPPPAAAPAPPPEAAPAPWEAPAPMPEPALAISGGPGALVAGTVAQLSAGAPDVTWSVDGVDGGDPRVGFISGTGLLQAPAAVPAGGSITVAAREGARTAQVAIRITAPPAQSAAPAAVLPAPTKRPKRLAVAAVRKARFVAVSAIPGRSGRLRVSAFVGKRRIGGCSLRVRATRTYACRVREPRGRARVIVVATLRDLTGKEYQQRLTAKRVGGS